MTKYDRKLKNANVASSHFIAHRNACTHTENHSTKARVVNKVPHKVSYTVVPLLELRWGRLVGLCQQNNKTGKSCLKNINFLCDQPIKVKISNRGKQSVNNTRNVDNRMVSNQIPIRITERNNEHNCNASYGHKI